MGRFFQYNRLESATSGSSNTAAHQNPAKDTQAAILEPAANCKAKIENWSHSERKGAQELSDDDRETLVGRRPRVYDCMKDFLRRKLFKDMLASQQQQPKQRRAATKLCHDDDVTSDYDEVDMLDSSYNADEEDTTTDCCSDYSSRHEDERQPTAPQPSSTSNNGPATKSTASPLRSALSLNCCQKTSHSDSCSTGDEEAEEIDSDAGFSDGCQLIADTARGSTQRRQRQRRDQADRQRQRRQSAQDAAADGAADLLEHSWFQPRITTKHALARLQQAEPGSFLVRRKSRTYELCVRVSDSKVKLFTVLATPTMHYKLKGAKKQFSTLKALVTHHSVMAEQLPVTLTLPRCEKAAAYASDRCSDDFDTFESLQILGILKSLQAKSFEFP